MATPVEKREFTVEKMDGNSIKLATRMPTNKELQDSEFEFSKAFNKAIISGIMPQSRLLEAMADAGVWSQAKDDEIEAQRQVVIKLEDDFDKAEESEKDIVGKTLAAERDTLFRLRQARTNMLSHSAEAKAEDAQRNYIVSCVTELASNSMRVWNSFDEFMNELDNNIIFRAVYEYLTFSSGLPSDFTEQLPEVKAAEEPKAEEAPKEEVKEEVKEEAKEEAPTADDLVKPKKVVAAGSKESK